MDFCAMNKFWVVSNKNTQACQKENLNLELNKEEPGFWNGPSGKEFSQSFNNFSLTMSGERNATLDDHVSDNEPDHNDKQHDLEDDRT